MKTIGIIIPDIHITGGAEAMALNLAAKLASRYQIYVLSIFSTAASTSDAFHTLHLGISLPRGPVGRWFSKPGMLNRILKKTGLQFDYLIGNNFFRYYALPDPSLPCRQIEIHHMNYYDGEYPPSMRVSNSIQLRNRIYKKLYKTVVLTEETHQLLAQNGVHNAVVIPNSSDAMVQAPISASYQVVAAAGRLTNQKGFSYLLRAWQQVAPLHPGWQLRIYGDGPLKAVLQAQINQLGLEGSVILMGKSRQLLKELLQTDIFVMSSLYEGFPLSILEAMNCGLPVVAFDCSTGPGEMITNGEDGWIVPVKNISLLAEKISDLITDAPLRKAMGANARINVQRYSWANIEPAWLTLLS